MRREPLPVLRGPRLVKALDIAYTSVARDMRREYSRLYGNERPWSDPLNCAIRTLREMGFDEAIIQRVRRGAGLC